MTAVTMGKEASLDGLEFDGDTVLCRVCGDKASGFHYGVHACEGCKGFFRRSIQQKIQYRPCLKNQQCNIMRVNRNRCQYCRLKKCIAVGMSRDAVKFCHVPKKEKVPILEQMQQAVRFGRVPKKEKARIIEQMQKSNLQIATTAMSSVLLSSQDLVQSVILAHRQTCDLSTEKARLMRDIALLQKDYVDCPAHMACPLNSCAGEMTDNQDWTDFSEYFAPAIKSVVDFAKLIPGFLLLNQDDQVTLLKAATFEVLLVRMACLFDNSSNTMMFANGKLFRRQTTGLTTSVGFLLDSMFDFAERFNKLNLTDDELALFSAIVLLSPDRPGVRQVDQVEKIQTKLTESLQNEINTGHKEDSTLFAKLLMKTTDLRTLNALHAEKTVGAGEKGEDSVEMQDSQIDSRSEDSTPSDSSSSLTAHTSCSGSGSTMDTSSVSSVYDSTGSLTHQPQGRFPADNSQLQQQQQMVLKTPYGTFYREDTGYYGMMPEQPRRRCHTLDRDSQISRPRLHTIEEGTRRRYTMDREYINKMVSKLSDRLEKRTQVNSMPGSVNNSAASSPVPILEEQYALLNANRDFIPISTPDSSACSSRTSPSCHKDTLQPFASSPNSLRQRSGSIGNMDDYGPMRPRCSSVSEGYHGAQARSYLTEQDYLGQDGQHYRMSPDMRRGSVGASHNLHARKKSLLVDRHPAYLTQGDFTFRKTDKQRSPLAVEESNKHHQIGSNGSAFQQVPRIQVPGGASWCPKMSGAQGERQEPPRLSITGPEDTPTDSAHMTPTMTPTMTPIVTPTASCTEVNNVTSPHSSNRNSPEADVKSEELYHKKFDKLRKHAATSSPNHSYLAPDETKKMENLSIQDEENMESDSPGADSMYTDQADMKGRSEKSVGDAHPQLLAQLKSGPQFQPQVHPAFPVAQYQQFSVPAPHAMPSPASQHYDHHNKHQNGTLPNVVLTVPQGPFVTRSSPSHSPVNSSMTIPTSVHTSGSKTKCLESMLRNDPSPCTNDQFLGVDKSKMAKCPSAENLTKSENEFNMGYSNGHPQMSQPMLAAFQGRGVDPAAMQHHVALYPQMYAAVAAGSRPSMAQYNQHLAGMQQLVYGNPQQIRRGSGGDIPLNLTQGPMMYSSQPTEAPGGGEMIKKIKEEVIS